ATAAAPLCSRKKPWAVILFLNRTSSNEAAAKARKAARRRLCGARRKRDGQPCIAKPLANGRCKFHGGMSTGPKTPCIAIMQESRSDCKALRQSLSTLADPEHAVW